MAIGAFNSQNNLLFLGFGFGLGLLIVSGVLSGAMLMGLDVARERVPDARAGSVATIRYRVHNTNRFFPPAFALSISEAGWSAAPPAAWWSRFGRRIRLPARPAPISHPLAFVAHVGPGQTAFSDAPVRALHRGVVPLTTIRVTTTFPFGLMVKTLEFDQPDEMVVTPEPVPCRAASLRTRAQKTRDGLASPRPGQGDEFFALREYRPGDAQRQIAWRASARRGHLLVRQNASPAPERLWIVLLIGAGQSSEALDERAIGLAAGIIEDAARAGMAIGLAVPLREILVPPRTGTLSVLELNRTLGRLDLHEPRAPGALPRVPASVIEHSSRIIIVSSSAAPELAPALRHITTVVFAHKPSDSKTVPESVTAERNGIPRQKGAVA